MHSPAGRRIFAGVALFLLCLPLGALRAADDAEIEAEVKSLVARMEKAEESELWRLSRQLDGKSVPVLKRILPDLEPRTRLAVARALIDLGESGLGLETLVALSGKESPAAVRVPAIEILGEKGSDAQEESLLLLLDDAFDPRVRIALARTLWQLTYNLRAKEELKAVLRSTDDVIRTEGALALAEIGAIDAARPVLVEIQDEPTPRGRLARALLEQARWREMLLARGTPGARPAVKPKEDPSLHTEYTDALLQQILRFVRQYYQDAPELTDVDLLEAAAKGIMDALDPHPV
ncbi:MAG: HEAT repeat domain-containing protein, partial [Planctomycetota bacterium]